MSLEKVSATVYPSWILRNILTPEECREYIQTIERKERSHVQCIQSYPHISEKIWEKIQDLLPEDVRFVQEGLKRYRLVGLSEYVTLSKHRQAISIHQDARGNLEFQNYLPEDLSCFFKLAIYLNEVSSSQNEQGWGGTYFYTVPRQIRYKVFPETGSGILFDMREWHSGGPIPIGKIKYMIGFRLIYLLDST